MHPTAQQAPRKVLARCALVVAAGAAGLNASLRLDHSSSWFPLAALGVALIWAVGAWWSGWPGLGCKAAVTCWSRQVACPMLAGVLLALPFLAGALLAQRIDSWAAQVHDVLGFTQSGSLLQLSATTLLSGIAEELFFRGSLYNALPQRYQVAGSTALYLMVTLLTGNLMLTLAAAAVGAVASWQRQTRGTVMAPILTHLTWSMIMLHVLPHLL